ncbi:hypothetical protein SAMN05880582_11244 [Rhizobium sp. RU20A]|uniref:vWA domain-containing protein n=1 Tax=Rhizobium sp. RU20A TaxID=1907412 RepID=UPI000955C03C|nr:VWA domain-containing protein [Rhizobium sp. RU20A]SIR40184.1 hypothetical protein SAMN05880582_11244 [Rhizobium sp. RU20A]
MLIPFFLMLRAERVPVTLRELLVLLEGMEAGLVDFDVESFYFLARAALIKDERHIDRFDRVFAQCFKGLDLVSGVEGEGPRPLPEEWLRKLAERHLTEEEKALIESLGGFDALMETLRQRLAEQKERHQGGSKWIGTAGTSPFGAYGYNPEGVRIGQAESRHRRAVKVWDRRDFRDYDDDVEFGTRNIKVALRRLRRFVREGAADELDLPATIRATAEQGYIDVVTRPERRNAVRMLMFLDVGGSMDGHVRDVEMLFSAARSEFRHLEHFYFHNCVYEGVWKTNSRRHVDRIATEEVLRTYGSGYKLCFVGDAAMSPYELTHSGGSVEHWNSEPGALWLERLATQFPGHVWLNPVRPDYWGYTASIGLVQRLMGGRMFPLTLSGLTDAMRALLR